jgi:DNA-binding transcriptional LysR family regulator
MVSRMELQRLRSFVESARLGSFAAAAQALGYTAPAVSQHVALLERELGCELLVRGARGVSTTPAGAILQARAERLLADAHLAGLAVREQAGQLRSLRVGAFPSAAQYLLPDALATLRAAHPDVELTLLHFEPPDGLAQLAAGEVDAVITHRYPGVTQPASTGVRLEPLIADPLDLIVPADHRLAAHKRVDAADLRDEVFISGTPNDPNRIALEAACASAGFSPRVAFETVDYAVTATLVSKGFGIALVPRLSRSSDGTQASAITVDAGKQRVARQIMLAHRTAERSTLIAEILEILHGRTAPNQPS